MNVPYTYWNVWIGCEKGLGSIVYSYNLFIVWLSSIPFSDFSLSLACQCKFWPRIMYLFSIHSWIPICKEVIYCSTVMCFSIFFIKYFYPKGHSFVKSLCTIFSLWKQDPPHQTFEDSQSWHQLSVYENKILVQNCLQNEWTLNKSF